MRGDVISGLLSFLASGSYSYVLYRVKGRGRMLDDVKKEIFKTYIEPGYQILRPYTYDISNRVDVFLKKQELIEHRYQVRDRLLDLFRNSTPEDAREWYRAFEKLNLETESGIQRFVRLCENLVYACLAYRRTSWKYKSPFWPWELARLHTSELPNEYPKLRMWWWRFGTWMQYVGVDLFFLAILLLASAIACVLIVHR